CFARPGANRIDDVIPRTASERVRTRRFAHSNGTHCELPCRRSFPSNAIIPNLFVGTGAIAPAAHPWSPVLLNLFNHLTHLTSPSANCIQQTLWRPVSVHIRRLSQSYSGGFRLSQKSVSHRSPRRRFRRSLAPQR